MVDVLIYLEEKQSNLRFLEEGKDYKVITIMYGSEIKEGDTSYNHSEDLKLL